MSEQERIQGRRKDEDADAILNRRRFLIESTLAGAGLGALAAGCEKEPQPCLKVAPPKPSPCLKLPAPDTATPPVKPKTAVEPQPCLQPLPPKPATSVAPQPCLDVAPVPKPKSGTAPQPCLSMPAPKVCLRIAPKPKVCLSLEEVK
ncbi:MAG: hypothetical protein FJ290_27450 [Planctomycetes bacterium]|nr:hypothetical protein [Planctomycetota bacterium]